MTDVVDTSTYNLVLDLLDRSRCAALDHDDEAELGPSYSVAVEADVTLRTEPRL